MCGMRGYRQRLLLLILLLLPGVAWAQTAMFTTPRSPAPQGVAPLAMWLDATATSCSGWTGCTDPYIDLDYAWDFDDPDAGTWTHSGRDKNVAYGPDAFHVYETPGTYTVTLTVTDGAGATNTDTENVIVDDPAVTFADALTYCFANTGGTFQGCPHDPNNDGTCEVQGGNCIVSSNSSTAMATCNQGAGRRCMFARGDTFDGSGGVGGGGSEGIIQAFDSSVGPGGAKPIFDHSSSGNQVFGGSPNDLRIVDIHAKCAAGEQLAGYDLGSTQYLALRMDHEGCDAGHVHTCSSDWDSGCAEIAIVEQTSINHEARWGTYGSGEYLADMGNTFVSGTFSHNIRRPSWRHIVSQHNRLEDAEYHALKYHAVYGATSALESRYAVVSDNVIENADGYTASLGEADNHTGEHLSNVIVERNLIKNLASSRGIWIGSADTVAIRSNVIEISNIANTNGILITRRCIPGSCDTNCPCGDHPDNIQIYNNTILCSACDVADSQSCVTINASVTNASVKNAICYSDTAVLPDAIDGTPAEATNLSSEDGDFPAGSPFAAALDTDMDYGDAALDRAKNAIDAGTDLALPIRDGNLELFGGTWEVGAFMYGEGGSSNTTGTVMYGVTTE